MLELALLGRLGLWRNGHPLPETPPVKGQALLAYLAMRRQPCSRSALAGLLWGDLSEEAARANLRLTLSRLRPLVGDYLVIGRQSVAFDSARHHRLDVAELEELTSPRRWPPHAPRSEALLDFLDPLVTLYRGEFLEGFELADAPEFEGWLLVERERLARRARDTLICLVEIARGTGRLEEGIRAARRLVMLEPWNENAHRHLMWLLATDGQRAAALVQFEICARALEEELAVEAEPVTLELYEQIRDGAILPARPAVTSPPASLSNLPLQLTPFIGRAAEKSLLRERLTDETYRLVTLSGAGGIGKTRLALDVAQSLSGRYAHGIWFVSLVEDSWTQRNTEPGDISVENQLATAIGAAIGIGFTSAAEPRQQLLSYLGTKQCLLILDNFESFMDGANLVLEILTSAPQVTVLITSREPLNLQAEYLFLLEGLPVPDHSSVSPAGQYDSLTLFCERAERAAGRPLAPEPADGAGARICRFLDGLPLAIELAASWARQLTIAEIENALRQEWDDLTTHLRDIPPRHRSLRVVFDHSWRLLARAEREALARLSLFRGHFTKEAAALVADTSPSLLAALAAKSLLARDAGDYYRMHDLVRRFAAEKQAALAPDSDTLRERHATYFLELIAMLAPNRQPVSPPRTPRSIAREMDDVRQAWREAASLPRPTLLARALDGMSEYWEYMGLFLEGEQALAEAVESLGQPPAESQNGGDQGRNDLLARLLAERAYLLYELTRYDEALETARLAVRYGKLAEAPRALAAGHLRLGQVLWGKGSYQEARPALEEGLHQAGRAGAATIEALLLRTLAAVAWRLGDMAEARACCERSLRLFHETNDRRNETKTRHLLGIIAQNQGRHEEAREIVAEVLRLAREIGDRRMEEGAHSMLALVASNLGNVDEALYHFEQDLALTREMGAIWSQAVASCNLGDLNLRVGAFDRARRCYDEALLLGRQQKISPVLESNVLAFMGLLESFESNYQQGEACCRRSLELARQVEVAREQAFALLFLGYNLEGMARHAEAGQAYEEAEALWTSLGDNPRMIESVAGRARVAVARGEDAAAKRHAETIRAHLEQHTLLGADDPVRVYLTLYQVLAQANDPRAGSFLAEADAFLQERSTRIKDPTLKQAYLTRIPSHQALAVAHRAAR